VTRRLEAHGDEITTSIYTVNYQATGTGKISVKWITKEADDGACGGAVLYAAALS
jgi:hypothetical protein